MNRFAFLFSVLACAGLGSPVFADIRLETLAEPREARVGDPIELTIIARFSSDVKPLPLPPDISLGSFTVLNASVGRPQTGKSGFQQTTAFTLTIYDVGVATVPAVPLLYQLADGTTREIRTPEIPIHIKSVLTPDSTDIRDIKGLIRSPWEIARIMALILLALVTAWWFWKRRRGSPAAGPPGPPPRPSHEVALEALDRLEEAMAEPAKIFYSRLADILRLYIENRFQAPALDRTTSELFLEMRRRNVESGLCLEAREILETCDLAKFAKWEAPVDERRRHRDQARQFVLKSAPRPIAESRAVPV
jgi:hypothetical protein